MLAVIIITIIGIFLSAYYVPGAVTKFISFESYNNTARKLCPYFTQGKLSEAQGANDMPHWQNQDSNETC